MSERPIARLLAVLALLVLGGFALARLPLELLPRRAFPQLTVTLSLSQERDPGEVTRNFVEPVEGAVRSLGRVRGMAGEVGPRGARLTVRFLPGTDVLPKAARLDSELARLARRLGDEATLAVEPETGDRDDGFALVWLTGAEDVAAAYAAAEEVRALPGVRTVELVGVPGREVRVELAPGTVDPWGTAARVEAEVARALSTTTLGTSRRGDRLRPVVTGGLSPAGLADLPIPMADQGSRDAPVPQPAGSAGSAGGASLSEAPAAGAVPLRSLGAIVERLTPAGSELRRNGRPARALVVVRSSEAPPLALDRALRQELAHLPGGVRGEVGWSEADPLRTLMARLGWGALAASLFAALGGAWLAGRWGALALGLAVPTAVAAGANGFLLAGVGLHLTTLVALAVAAALLLPLAAQRVARRPGTLAWMGTAVAAAAALPVAVGLAGAELGPILAEPAKAFLVAVVAGAAAMFLLPRPPGPAARLSGRRLLQYALRPALRHPPTVLLAAGTALYLAATLAGSALLPRPGNLQPGEESLRGDLQLPAGTTLAETVHRTAVLEAKIAKFPEVEAFWVWAFPGRARFNLELAPAARSDERRTRLALRLQFESNGTLQVSSDRENAGRPGSFVDEFEDRAEADEEGNRYKVVLRGGNLVTVRAAHDRLLDRLASLKVRPFWMTGSRRPAVHLVLAPRPGTSGEEAAGLAARLRRECIRATGLPLPGLSPAGERRTFAVVPAGTPNPEDADRHIPQLAELLGRPRPVSGVALTATDRLTLREEVIEPSVLRQAGRFVVPIALRIPLGTEEGRTKFRREIDRSLSVLPLPAATDLERPSLTRFAFRPERLRLLALGLAVPLLLATVAAVRLGSIGRGLAVLAALALGLAAALPLVRASLGRIDELTLLAVAAALALALPSVATVAASPAAPGSRLYRALRGEAPVLLASLPALAALLAGPTLGAERGASPWAAPLQAAALAGGLSLAVALAAVPALLLAGEHYRRRDPEEDRRRRRPPEWSEPGEVTLAVRSLTKVYGGRFRALSGVSFSLTPGIIGLLGRNGAGKTTLLRLLTGLLEPTRGQVLYRGVPITPENLADYRVRIGFLPQEFNAYPGFTAEQFLDHWAIERGLADPRRRRQEIESLLEAVGLTEHAGRKVRDYSGGMRQRIGIARALLGAPPILIVDEPTTGLDVESRGRFRQILLEQASQRVVIFSTHIASDIEAAASRILLLHHGRLCFDGTPEELAARARGRVFRALVADADLLDWSRRYRVTSRVRVLEGIDTRAIARPGEEPAGELVEPNLEEAYLAEVDIAAARQG